MMTFLSKWFSPTSYLADKPTVEELIAAAKRCEQARCINVLVKFALSCREDNLTISDFAIFAKAEIEKENGAA